MTAAPHVCDSKKRLSTEEFWVPWLACPYPGEDWIIIHYVSQFGCTTCGMNVRTAEGNTRGSKRPRRPGDNVRE